MLRMKGLSSRAKPILYFTATSLPWPCDVSQLVALGFIWFNLTKKAEHFSAVSELNRFNELFSEHQSQLRRLGWLWLGKEQLWQEQLHLDELDSTVKSHAGSCILLFYTSDTRVNDVNPGQELQSEVRHCWRLGKEGWPVLFGREREWKSIPLRKQEFQGQSRWKNCKIKIFFIV